MTHLSDLPKLRSQEQSTTALCIMHSTYSPYHDVVELLKCIVKLMLVKISGKAGSPFSAVMGPSFSVSFWGATGGVWPFGPPLPWLRTLVVEGGGGGRGQHLFSVAETDVLYSDLKQP